MFELCCSPISGGNFISQVAILTFLLEVRYKSREIEKTHFDLYLGASGGSLSNTLCTFFNESKESIERVLYSLDSKMFVQNWWKGKVSFISSKFVSVFKDSIYQSGKGAVENFKGLTDESHFDPKNIPENWFLTYNNDKNIPSVHSVFCQENSNFQLEEDDFEAKYLDSKFEKIIETVMASASIPGLKKSVELDGENHVDGGVANPSPYFYFSELIYQKNKKKEITPPYHFHYLLPHDLSIEKEDTGAWVSDVLLGIQKMIIFSIMKDKDFVFENWLRLIKKGKKDLLRVKKENIKKKEILQLLEIYNQYDYFAVFSTPSNTIDITSFDKKDLKESFTKCYDSIFIEIFINKNE
jgi:hypothetical protein